ncbi:MAG: aminoglycoside phosphotransferase family protein [Acidimicrobiales bacterium]
MRLVPPLSDTEPTEGASAWMLDADEVLARIRRSGGVDVDGVRPTYLRDKPGESLVVGYDLWAGPTRGVGYLRWSSDPDRAGVEWHKALAMGPVDTDLGPGVVRVDDRSILRILPNDARLRRARWYLQPRKLKRSLAGFDPDGRVLSGSATTVALLTYKPERRFVARLDLGYRDGHRRPVILRYTATPTATRLAATADHLRAHGVDTAGSLARLEGGRVAIDELLPGVDLRTTAQAVAHEPAVAVAVANVVAEQLVALHRASTPAVAPVRARNDELAAAGASLRWLCGRGDVDTGLARALWHRLGAAGESLPAAPGVMVHGDLHDRNVLVDLDGGPQAALIDLERVAIGEAALDLGCLAAHGIAGAIMRNDLAAGRLGATIVAEAATREGVDGRCVALYTAVGLVEAALNAARRLESAGAPEAIPQLLEAALAHCPPPRSVVR